MIKDSKILITGGYGFIGGHIAVLLTAPELGNQVTLMDINFGTETTGDDFKLGDRNNVSTIYGSVTDIDVFSSLPCEFDYIIHTAGFLGVNDVAKDQTRTLDVNVLGTRNCLSYAARHNVKPRVLCFSTSEIYGVQCAGAAEHEPALIPSSGARWCYAASKLAGEYYFRAYNQRSGVNGGIVRPFNVFGPHRYGSNAMTALVTQAVNNQIINISGDGLQVRSWCYIDDFCSGALLMLEQTGEGVEVFNIGDDRNVFTMVGLANKIIEVTGSKSVINILNNKIEDVFYRIPDIDRSRKLLGYEPVEDFESALIKVAKWVRDKYERNYD